MFNLQLHTRRVNPINSQLPATSLIAIKAYFGNGKEIFPGKIAHRWKFLDLLFPLLSQGRKPCVG
jgi:hypothetical protein